MTKRYFLMELDTSAPEAKFDDQDQRLIRHIQLSYPNMRVAAVDDAATLGLIGDLHGTREIHWDGRAR